MRPVSFIQAGGLQGETSSFSGRPATRCAALIMGSSASWSRAIEKLSSAKSPSRSTWA